MNFESYENTESALHADKVGRFVPTHSLSIYSGWIEISCGCCGYTHDVLEQHVRAIAKRESFCCPECQTRRTLVFDRFVGCEARDDLH